MPGTPASARSISNGELVSGTDGSLIWKGSRVWNAPPPALWAGAPSMADNDEGRVFQFFDDFLQQASATASNYTTYTDMNDGATGTNAFAALSGGVLNVVTAATLDDYHGLRTTDKPFLFVAGKELWFEAGFKVTEAATNASSWLVGLMDTFTTGGLQTGASGPLGSFSGAVIAKVQATMTPKFTTSNSSTQTTGASLGTVVSGQKIRAGFYFDGLATTSNLTPYLDIGDGNGFVAGAAQQLTLASLNQMSIVATIKAGGSNAETLALDYLKVLQLR